MASFELDLRTPDAHKSMSPPLVSAKRDLAACDQCGKRRVGRALRGDAGLPQDPPERSQRAQRAQRALLVVGSVPCPSAHISAKLDLAACDQCGKRRVGRALRGDAGLSCLANVCRVGPPHPKRELHKLHKCPGVAPQPMAVARACWADGRPARRPRGVQGARHPPERAAASPTGARTARRRHRRGELRAGACCWYLLQG